MRGEVVSVMAWESYDDLDVLERPPERRYPARHGQRPSVLRQWAWGLWDMTLRLIEFGLKMFGAALLVVVLLVCGAIWVWHHGVEAGVDKLQEITTTTTTP